MAFKMRAGSEGPMKKNYPAAFKKEDGKDGKIKKGRKQTEVRKLGAIKQTEVRKLAKDTRTDSQKARDKRELERQTRIQGNIQKSAERSRKRKQMELKELGFFQDDDGKIVRPFGPTHKTLKKKSK